MVLLIKPQFEAGKEKVGKKGVVREKSTHVEVIEKVRAFALEHGFSVLNLSYSPIKGPEGNIEYLLHIRKEEETKDYCPTDSQTVVDLSHEALDK